MTALNPVYTSASRSWRRCGPTTARWRPRRPRSARSSCSRMVEMPNPEQSFNKYPHQLSGGQRQRAMIAQSISCDPLLLIADEPTTALDVTVQAEVLDLLRNLHQRLDSAIILITHDMGVVADLADRIMVMKNGVVVESGTVDEIFHAPAAPVHAAAARGRAPPRPRRARGRSTPVVGTSDRGRRSRDRRHPRARHRGRRRDRRDADADPVVRGRRDRLPQARTHPGIPRGRAHRPRDLPGRDRRSRRRVRLGQDDARPRRDRAHARSPRESSPRSAPTSRRRRRRICSRSAARPASCSRTRARR